MLKINLLYECLSSFAHPSQSIKLHRGETSLCLAEHRQTLRVNVSIKRQLLMSEGMVEESIANCCRDSSEADVERVAIDWNCIPKEKYSANILQSVYFLKAHIVCKILLLHYFANSFLSHIGKYEIPPWQRNGRYSCIFFFDCLLCLYFHSFAWLNWNWLWPAKVCTR